MADEISSMLIMYGKHCGGSGPSSLIALLTAHISQEVCHRYWPPAGMQQYGEFSVSVVEESMHEGHLERVFNVTDSKVVDLYV